MLILPTPLCDLSRVSRPSPDTSTSLRIARELGKGPYYARKIRHNAAYLSKHGALPANRHRKKGPTLSWFDNEIVLQNIKLYLAGLGHGELNPKVFRHHICTEILPSLMTADYVNYSTEIAMSTVRRWLHKLGYESSGTKKGVYVDGHERPDVREYRDKFLKNMEIYEK